MTTINNIRENLTLFLRNNKEMLRENSINIGEQLLNSYYKVLLFYYYTDHRTGILEMPLLLGSIDKGLDNPENPSLQQRFVEYGLAWDNEVRFRNIYCQTKEMGFVKNNQAKSILKFLSKESEELFWQEKKNVDLYNRLGNWKLFNDIEIDKNELENYKQNNYQVNAQQWHNYANQLANYFFPNYTLNENLSSNANRFLKQINENWYFGFEYDAKLINKAKKYGFVEFSLYLNIVLIHKDFNKKDKLDYIFKQRNDILSLGKLNNPFFDLINPPDSCSTRYRIIENAPNNFTLLSNLPVEFVKLDSDNYLVKYNNDYGEVIKKYLQYYFSITAFTATGYLEYVEKSVRDCIEYLEEK
jgi:hypothetical protein